MPLLHDYQTRRALDPCGDVPDRTPEGSKESSFYDTALVVPCLVQTLGGRLWKRR